jgi:hypothetical protein
VRGEDIDWAADRVIGRTVVAVASSGKNCCDGLWDKDKFTTRGCVGGVEGRESILDVSDMLRKNEGIYIPC